MTRDVTPNTINQIHIDPLRSLAYEWVLEFGYKCTVHKARAYVVQFSSL